MDHTVSLLKSVKFQGMIGKVHILYTFREKCSSSLKHGLILDFLIVSETRDP